MIYVQRLYHNLKCYHIGGQKVAGTEKERYYYSCNGHGCSCSKMPKTSYMRVQWNPKHIQPIAKLNKKVSCGRFSTDFIPNDQPRFFCGSKALVTADLLTPAL